MARKGLGDDFRVAHRRQRGSFLARRWRTDPVFRDTLAVLAVLVALTLLFRLSGLDMALARLFWHAGDGWAYGRAWPFMALKRYGTWPAYALAGVGGVGFLLSFRWPRARWLRRASVFLVLALVLGPGVVVNSVFKEHWGRPRPREVHAFRGERPFLPVWVKGHMGRHTSFASGHASAGFFLMVPYFLFRRASRRAGRRWLAAGLAAGLLLGLTRMAQGAHFASDVLWAAGFTYLAGLLLYYLLGLDRLKPSLPGPLRRFLPDGLLPVIRPEPEPPREV